MTSLDVNVSPSEDKSSSILGCINNCSTSCDKSSVGALGIHDHLPAKNNASVGAGCGCDHSAADISCVLPSGSLNNVPGETTTE